MREETYVRALNSFSWFTVAFILAYLCLWLAVNYNSGAGEEVSPVPESQVAREVPETVSADLASKESRSSGDSPGSVSGSAAEPVTEPAAPGRSRQAAKKGARKGKGRR